MQPGCLSHIDEKRQGEGHEGHREDNRPDPVAPSPGRMFQQAVRDWWTDPNGDEKGHIWETREKGSVEEVARVSHEDLDENLQARGSSRVENLGGGEGLDAVGARHLNVSDDVQEKADGEGFQTAEYIGDFGHGRFDDSWKC